MARKAADMGWGGIIPPRIVMPNTLLVPSDVMTATEAEELAAMATVLAGCEIEKLTALFPKPPIERGIDWALDMAGVLLGIEMILGEAALLMSDVKPALDKDRWRDLAVIEGLFIKTLEENGVEPRCVARRKAVAAGCREPGVEEIVLPSSVDVPEAFIR